MQDAPLLNLRDSPNSAILFDRREQSHNRVAASFIFGWKGVVPMLDTYQTLSLLLASANVLIALLTFIFTFIKR